MPLTKVPVVWGTGAGGSGLSVFYSDFSTDPTVELGTFFNAIKAVFPNVVTWDIPSSGDVIDETTGLITGTWTGGTAATVTATGGTGSYAAGTGAYVRWQTGGIVNGRRVKGRTFLCPIITTAFDNNGTIASTQLSTMQTAVNALVTSGKLRIWHRPPKGGSTGARFTVTAGTVPDKVTSLRTRRS